MKIENLMKLLGWSRSTISAHLNGYREPNFLQRRDYERVLRLPEMYLEPDTLPADVAIAPRTGYAPIPEWPELSLAASHWVDSDQVGEVYGDDLIEQAHRARRFRVRISGECMYPKWHSGDLIEFVMLQDGAAFAVGGDYYVQTPDGATFKRCLAVDAKTITIGCTNGKGRWVVERSAILRAAQAASAIIVRQG